MQNQYYDERVHLHILEVILFLILNLFVIYKYDKANLDFVKSLSKKKKIEICMLTF
jgi:hypothetical protein